MSRRFALIVNPTAGGGRALAAHAAAGAELQRAGASARWVETTSAAHAEEEARQAVAAGETVVAVGGDGLVGLLAGAVRDSPSAMALVPAGRGNDFARVLGIPSDPAEAARLAMNGPEQLLDVGEVDGRVFVGIASLGLDSDANRMANDARILKGNLVYLYAAVRALAAWKHARFTVEVDGRRHQVHGYSVAVANSRAYGGGMILVPQAVLDDGLLDVLMVRAYPKLAALRDFPKVFRGNHLNEKNFLVVRGREIAIRADRPFTVYADGDPIGELPATIRVRERSLRVIVPG